MVGPDLHLPFAHDLLKDKTDGEMRVKGLT